MHALAIGLYTIPNCVVCRHVLLDAPWALLHATTHLLAWAQTRWPEVVSDYGLKDRLRFLWHWGFGRGLARLV